MLFIYLFIYICYLFRWMKILYLYANVVVLCSAASISSLRAVVGVPAFPLRGVIFWRIYALT